MASCDTCSGKGYVDKRLDNNYLDWDSSAPDWFALEVCPDCSSECSLCDGEGYIEENYQEIECPACWEFDNCPECGGDGEIAYEEAFFHPKTGQPMGETQFESCGTCGGRGGIPVEQLR